MAGSLENRGKLRELIDKFKFRENLEMIRFCSKDEIQNTI